MTILIFNKNFGTQSLFSRESAVVSSLEESAVVSKTEKWQFHQRRFLLLRECLREIYVWERDPVRLVAAARRHVRWGAAARRRPPSQEKRKSIRQKRLVPSQRRSIVAFQPNWKGAFWQVIIARKTPLLGRK